VHVQVTGSAEQRVLEVMMFQIRQVMRHVRLPGQERLLPDRLAAATDQRGAMHVGRQLADQQLRSDRRGAQFRMRQIQVVHALHHVVGKLIREREAEAERRAVAADDVDPGKLRLLAAVQCEVR
jgi:hypothetical protein